MERWQRIDIAADGEARELLRLCCGAPAWIERMLGRRPFGRREEAVSAARDIWFELPADQWREAFAHHPRIGDVDALRRKFATSAPLSEREQAGVTAAPPAVLQALLDGNRAYEARFGHIFIVCATGKTAEEMLAMLNARLKNDPESEIRIAAEEHARICELRLLQECGPA
jgi:2-oxo-4-hydroxy-4-carboxy-5-ureidoimidazoline decarboxylase